MRLASTSRRPLSLPGFLKYNLEFQLLNVSGRSVKQFIHSLVWQFALKTQLKYGNGSNLANPTQGISRETVKDSSLDMDGWQD